jgi:hypothetical protein
VTSSPADMAQWWPGQDWEHFQKHRYEFRSHSVAEYDESARRTIRLGKGFTYTDPDWGTPRVGYFAVGSGRFTALNASQTRILTHFIPSDGERYVRTLPDSTYTH